MKLMQTAVLLLALAAGTTVAIQQYHYRILQGVTTCDGHTCGTNARCTYIEGRPVCACLNLYRGDALTVCHRVECDVNEDCLGSQVCSANRCVNVCSERSPCGTNAICQVTSHQPSCKCPPDHTGNAFENCIYDPQAPCKQANICGANTKCEVRNGVAQCTCLPGFTGSPFQGCRHECESDFDCASHQRCSRDYRCENPCLTDCGTNANCEVVNHQAKCSCPKNWLGNARVACHPECQSHSECPSSKPACFYQKCVNPCIGACGENANCEIKGDGVTPVCSCPRDRTGDPFTFCRLFEDRDLCEPNPCGTEAICTPGHDNTGAKRPVCTCPHGYFGNALRACQKGECLTDSDCRDHEGCVDFTCKNACNGHQCGSNASCTAKRHVAVCTCDPGTRGDALIACNAIDSRSGLGRVYRYHK